MTKYRIQLKARKRQTEKAKLTVRKTMSNGEFLNI